VTLIPATLRRAASRDEGTNAKVPGLAGAPGQAEASLRQLPQVYHQQWAAALAARAGTEPD
jgi:hypothetical protein